MTRKVNEKRPEEEGRFLMLTPPMSNEVQLFSGGRKEKGRGVREMGATCAVTEG